MRRLRCVREETCWTICTGFTTHGMRSCVRVHGDRTVRYIFYLFFCRLICRQAVAVFWLRVSSHPDRPGRSTGCASTVRGVSPTLSSTPLAGKPCKHAFISYPVTVCHRHMTGCVFNAVPRPVTNRDCRRVWFARAIRKVLAHSTVASEGRVAIEYKYFVVKQGKRVRCRQIIPFKRFVYCRGNVVMALFPSPSVLCDWESDMIT